MATFHFRLFLSNIPIKILHAFLIFHMSATWSVYLKVNDLIILSKESIFRDSLLHSFPYSSIDSSTSGSDILLNTLFSKALNLFSS
jgi:hypothetical protein